MVRSNIAVNIVVVVIVGVVISSIFGVVIIGIVVINNFKQAEMLERSLLHEEKGKIYIGESSLGDGGSIIGDCGYVGREVGLHNSI